MDDLQDMPIRAFISPFEAREILGFKWPKSLNDKIKDHTIRTVMISGHLPRGKIRMIYKPDVMDLKERLTSLSD